MKRIINLIMLIYFMIFMLCFAEDIDETLIDLHPYSDEPIIISVNEPEIEEEQPSEEVHYEVRQIESTSYDIPPYPGMKKWMDYRVFGGSTRQRRLQQYCITDSFGLRGVDGLYCIAVGSRFGTEIGQRIDLILKNGTVIPCVMGDQKANVHTDSTNTFSNTTHNLCCSEFIVDTRKLRREAAQRGDVSLICDIWNSPVVKIITYDINILDDLEAGLYDNEEYDLTNN